MNANVCVENHREQLSGQTDAAILIDSRGIPLSPTAEAVRVLLYPQDVPSNRKGRRLLLQRIRSLFPDGPLADATPQVGEFLSGRRHYLYRVYRLRDATPGGPGPAAIVIFERYRPPLIPSPASLAPYRFTAREEQVLRLVFEGLSNKEIAGRMGISPNTVKAFLRLIMTKMQVTSRFAILGKLLGQTALHSAGISVASARLARKF